MSVTAKGYANVTKDVENIFMYTLMAAALIKSWHRNQHIWHVRWCVGEHD